MTDPLTSILRCDDGAELLVKWAYAGAETCEWQRDGSHWPQPKTPMDVWLNENGWPPGGDRAWNEVGMEPPALFFRFQLAGPFLYARMNPFEPGRMAGIAARYQEVSRQYGNARGFWQQYCEPRIQDAWRQLAATPTDTPLRSSAELWGYGFHQTFTCQSLLGEANLRLIGLLAPIAADDPMLRSLEVTQGGDNASQAIDGEIWQLTDLARRTPAVARILDDNHSDGALASLRREPGAVTFVAAFDALIERHGSRSQGWELVLPTWRERPEAPLSLIRAQLKSDGVSPEALTARSESRRRVATEQALAQLPPEKHDEFAKIVAEMDGYVSVREGRAYWQMVITGEMRALLLRRGSVLVREGSVDRPDDILFLVPEDFEDQPASDLRPLVAARRREWDRWRGVTPPATIGAPPAAAPAVSVAADQLRGAPASRGEATGPARIIRAPEEAARLQSGDILVCVMTTPAWTPLFSIAAGIITETGGALSHPAITAREYGIPAVVAVQGATTRIREGQIVTIDGGAGTVALAE